MDKFLIKQIIFLNKPASYYITELLDSYKLPRTQSSYPASSVCKLPVFRCTRWNVPVKQFTLPETDYLKRETTAYYCTEYIGFGKPGNPDFINHLKNTFNNRGTLAEMGGFYLIPFYHQAAEILKHHELDTVCIVPRSKSRQHYSLQQFIFTLCVASEWLDGIKEENLLSWEINNGIDYIIRHTDTKTTHLSHSARAAQYAGDGDFPYPGITKDTCELSDDIKGKRILLVDDIYTQGVNVDEDCIQALYDKGAEEVVLFTIAKTVRYGTSNGSVRYYDDSISPDDIYI